MIDFGLQGGELLFADQWPEIENINGRFRLLPREFQFYANEATTLNNYLQNVIVSFPDFKSENRDIYINGSIKGRSEDKMNYLHQSPLEGLFAEKLAPLQLEGSSNIKLSLHVPLKDTKQTEVNGVLQVSDNVLRSDEWKLDIKKLNGELAFANHLLRASLITGRVFETPVNFSVDVNEHERGREIEIKGLGVFSDSKITEALDYYIDKKHWGRFLRGQADLIGHLIIPFGLREGEVEPVALSLTSQLTNMQVELPYPLQKPKGKVNKFSLSTELTGPSRKLFIDFNPVQALFNANATDQEVKIDRGAVGFNQKVSLPQEQGFRFNGTLPRFSWSEWRPLIFPEQESDALFKKGGPASSMFFDVKIDDLEIFNKHFSEVAVFASQTVQNWTFHLVGPMLAGDINIPLNFEKSPLIANLDKLVISKELAPKENENATLDVKSLPAFQVDIKDLKYEDMHLGKFQINSKRIAEGQKFESIDVESKGATVTGTGQWILDDENKPWTNFNLSLSASNFGDALTAWGYKDVVIGGKGKIRGDFTWPQSPADFNLATLSGAMNIDLRDASVLDFDIGAAKIFSALLPRRLLLDFRDVIQKGMYFDTLKGKYTIEEGDAFTNSFALKGPVVDMDLAGKLGLGTKTFDKVVTVNRRLVGDSLPLVGTVINPVVGGGIFVVKKLFEKQIDDILSVQYTVEGKWGEPVITPVDKAGAEQDNGFEGISD